MSFSKVCFYMITALFWMTGTPTQAQMILVGNTANTSPTGPTSNLVDLDVFSGTATNIRNTGIFALTGIAFQQSTGFLFGLTSVASSPANSLVRIDYATGVQTLIGATGLSQIVEGDLAFNPLNGMLYGQADLAGVGARRLFQIDTNSGVATVIGSIPTSGDLSTLAFSPTGVLYSIDTVGNGNSVLHTIDPNTAQFLSSNTLNVNLGAAAGMAFSPMNDQVFVADGGTSATNLLYSLDVLSNSLSPIGPIGVPGGIAGLTFVSVPEPSSILLGAAVVFARMCVRSIRRLSRIL